jgi:hypothetical protein
MSAHVLPPLAVNGKSERKVNSLPPLGFELVILGMLAHLSNHSVKSHPQKPGFSVLILRYLEVEKVEKRSLVGAHHCFFIDFLITTKNVVGNFSTSLRLFN